MTPPADPQPVRGPNRRLDTLMLEIWRHVLGIGALAVAAALMFAVGGSPTAVVGSSTIAAGEPAAPAPGGVKPTIVLVHGAFADASSWGGEVAALQKQGYDARAIANPLENFDTDTRSVKDYLATLSGPIVLVGHSYGGSVITNAAEGNPNVKALVYVDAAAPDVGETTDSLSGANSVLTRPAAELFDPVPSSDGSITAAQLYLKKNIVIQHVGNDLPQTSLPEPGPANEPPRWPHCSRRRRTLRGRRFRPGTSSVAETRSSPPTQNPPWPGERTHRSHASTAAHT